MERGRRGQSEPTVIYSARHRRDLYNQVGRDDQQSFPSRLDTPWAEQLPVPWSSAATLASADALTWSLNVKAVTGIPSKLSH